MRTDIDDYLNQERAVGRAVGGEATFTLDPKKVRERVKTFCDEDTLYPLWRCMQAVIRVSKSDIFIQRQEQSWEIVFKWPGCPDGKAFSDLLNLGTTAGFDQAGHRVGQHLFFGLSAALGTGNYEIKWSGPQAQFEVTKKQFIVHEPTPEEYTKLSFSLDAGWWKRLTQQFNDRQIIDSMKHRLSYSPTPIHLERQELVPKSPQAPEIPWSSKFIQGSQLAWRFIRVPDQNLMAVPYPDLDYYRGSKDGGTFHLLRDPQNGMRPLSIAFDDPLRKNLLKGQTGHLSLALAARAHTALFLSLETGKQDWIIPISDGVLTEPVRVDIAGGGIVALTSEQALQFDLSGLKVVQNAAFEATLSSLKKQSSAMKKQLALSLANMAVKAEKMPRHYEQAIGYLSGGPGAAIIAGQLGSVVRNLFSGKDPHGE